MKIDLNAIRSVLYSYEIYKNAEKDLMTAGKDMLKVATKKVEKMTKIALGGR